MQGKEAAEEPSPTAGGAGTDAMGADAAAAAVPLSADDAQQQQQYPSAGASAKVPMVPLIYNDGSCARTRPVPAAIRARPTFAQRVAASASSASLGIQVGSGYSAVAEQQQHPVPMGWQCGIGGCPLLFTDFLQLGMHTRSHWMMATAAAEAAAVAVEVASQSPSNVIGGDSVTMEVSVSGKKDSGSAPVTAV